MATDTLLAEHVPRTPAGACGDCATCPLRALPGLFLPVSATELAVINALKRDEIAVDAGTTLIEEGAGDRPLFTLLTGWAMRYKTLPDGRRQILSVLLPGDFIGLQQKMELGASHGVEALTALRLCRFERDAVWALHRELPALGYAVTWLAAHGETMVDDNLLSVGRRSAEERVAAFVLTLYERAAPFDASHAARGLWLPLTQRHVADAMGLSLVHAHRVLRELSRKQLLLWRGQRLRLPDPVRLAELAKLRWPLAPALRPLI